jgi:hypothetical protein
MRRLVPSEPALRPRQRVRVVDANSRGQLLRFDGKEGRVYGGHGPGPLRFWPDGDRHTYPIDSPSRPGDPAALIVEPIPVEP